MIAVIADDFTGAAEIAGIGLRYNLEVELSTSVINDPEADLLVVCTDSRSLNNTDAQKVTADTAKKIFKLKPDFIYKKIDSVFRGHVLSELKIQMQQSGLKKALVIGANPSLGRTIKEGNYFINEKPISETGFAYDPEFAITDSSVLKMIKAVAGEVQVLKHTGKLPGEGIVIGEAVSGKDMEAWAGKADNNWLLAGAGDFFTALLDRQFIAKAQPVAAIELPHLYVSGTAFDKSQAFIKEVEKKLDCVSYLPISIMQTKDTDEETWLNSVSKILQSQKKVIVAIHKEEKIPPGVSAASLRAAMAKTVKKIIERDKIKELFIEGGSTAAAILDELGIVKLFPVNELKRGVVRMKAKDRYITVKPGSYELPEQIRKLYLLK